MRQAAITGAIVFACALGRSLTDGFGLVDESWFLQVVARVRDGDVLYRDVFLGTTPLAAYVTLAATHLFGIEIVVVKVVTNASFAASAVLASILARRAGAPAGLPLAVVAATFVWGRPYGNPPYTPMAMALFLAAALTALAAFDEKTPGVFKDAGGLGAGALAGLSFAAKQNVGLLALAAVGTAWLVAERRSGRQALAIAAGFVGTSALTLAPVAWTGGLPALWDYGFAGKGAYVLLGGVSYGESLQGWLSALSLPFAGSNLGAALHGVPIILPVAVAVAAASSARRLDRRAWLIVAFAGLATLSALPRWDRFHMTYAVPLHGVALAVIASTGARGARRVRLSGVLGGVVVALGFAVALQPAVMLAQGGRQQSTLPHFRGPLVTPFDEARLGAWAARMAREAGGQPAVILSLEAGFWHLSSGVRNPTPFDIPATTSLGASGVTWLTERLADGTIRQVCVDRRRQDRLVLADVAARVESTFERGNDVGPCTWYRARGR